MLLDHLEAEVMAPICSTNAGEENSEENGEEKLIS